MKFLSDDQAQAFGEKGYLVIDSWLAPAQLIKTYAEFDELFRSGKFKKAQITQTASQSGITRGDWTCWLDSSTPSFAQIEKELLHWIPLLNETFFCNVTSLEAHMAHYPPGPGYEKHLDQPKGKENRKITFVLYLNPQWSPQDGGELCLYDKSGQLLEKISPLGGRMVLFRSDLFPHEVLPCLRARRSLTGWFRNDAV
jgi:SM-20-related protein